MTPTHLRGEAMENHPSSVKQAFSAPMRATLSGNTFSQDICTRYTRVWRLNDDSCQANYVTGAAPIHHHHRPLNLTWAAQHTLQPVRTHFGIWIKKKKTRDDASLCSLFWKLEKVRERRQVAALHFSGLVVLTTASWCLKLLCTLARSFFRKLLVQQFFGVTPISLSGR